MVALVQNGEQTFLDANGDPLVAGEVYFYEVNTTTFKNTWQDRNQSVLNTNPVVLDGAGRAVIWGVGEYRQVVEDADGNQIWDRDVTDSSFISPGSLPLTALEDIGPNVFLGASTVGAPSEFPMTAAGRALAAGANAASQRTTLGLGTAAVLDTGTDAGDVVTYAADDGVIRLDNGSLTVPPYSFINDVDSGMFLAGANILGFSTNGTEQLRIDATGNVGRWQPGAFGSDTMCRFSELGTLQVASTNNSQFGKLVSDGPIIAFHRDTVKVGDIAVNATSTSYNTSSDYRLKQDFCPVFDAEELVMRMSPTSFAFKADPYNKVIGFIAHELQKVVPYAVTGEKDGETMQTVDHSKLVPILVAAIQELITRVEDLEDLINQ